MGRNSEHYVLYEEGDKNKETKYTIKKHKRTNKQTSKKQKHHQQQQTHEMHS
jgi:hypothetical protein